MDIKLKYRTWVNEKHTDISNSLTNSDIETFAIEFAEWLIKNYSIPAVAERREQLSCPHCGQLEPCAGNSPETCYHPKVC